MLIFGEFAVAKGLKKKSYIRYRLHIETLTDFAEETFWMIDRLALDYDIIKNKGEGRRRESGKICLYVRDTGTIYRHG